VNAVSNELIIWAVDRKVSRKAIIYKEEIIIGVAPRQLDSRYDTNILHLLYDLDPDAFDEFLDVFNKYVEYELRVSSSLPLL
jgi:hypothetical protein